jgi:hypothetical protein
VCIIEVHSLKICQRETHFVEVYIYIEMCLLLNNLGTEDENLTTDNVLQDNYFCFVMLDIGCYLRYKPVCYSPCAVSEAGFVPVCWYVR